MNWFEQKILGLFVKTKGRVSKPILGGLGHIFMLHRVLPESLRNQYTYNRDLAITPQFLENIIEFLSKSDYNFVSLDTVHDILTSGKKPKKKFVCFTLDDGYRDNLKFGFPIFEKHRIPFTIYVSNSFPNHHAKLWWYWLEDLVQQEEIIHLNGISYSCDSEKNKLRSFNKIRPILKNSNSKEMENYCIQFFRKSEEVVASEVKELSLSWEEVRQLSSQSLATIGAHTVNHVSLKHQDSKSLKFEIQKSREELETKISKEVAHFAYPYGGLDDVGKREFELTKTLGFKTATMNHPGNVFLQHKCAQMMLPRYPLGNSTTVSKMRQYLNGISHFSNNQFSKTLATL